MAILLWMAAPLTALATAETNPEALVNLLRRVCGEGAEGLITLVVDDSLADSDGGETFVLTAQDGKPCVKGSTASATTAGLNWYLNHYARVNLTWSNLTTDLSAASLPTPSGEEKHTATAQCRYYLNYCTFSYSMAFWTWERWEQEIDWMALHGINMPLMLVGADVVWRNALTALGYTSDEINDFIAGPGFQAWWLMNNLMGWGGENPDWWYERQEALSKKILARMRELGMEPVLPGYSGMVPSNVETKLGWTISDPGTWCGFNRPGFLDPSSDHFTEMSDLYYEELTKLMGTSQYYSMDPFHEGGNTTGVDLPAAYSAIEAAMNRCNADAQWVIQSWNENPRSECLSTVEKGKLLILDLFSDGDPKWQGGYQGHDFLYCMLHNFGGRVGMHGRLRQTISGYYDALSTLPSQTKGIGATPEGIETNPILYDALFELPWRETCDADEWLEEFVACRYGTAPATSDAIEAWQLIANSALDCQTSQQGTSEPVICARPSLSVTSVSSWSTSTIYYDREDIIRAAARLLAMSGATQSPNYGYDLCDAVRQAITDRANSLLKQINNAYSNGEQESYERLRDMFLQLILDQDRLLSTNETFMLGRWTTMARNVCDEASGTTNDDRNWMEWNARTLITVWGPSAAAASLHDYSNREWAGLLRDFHYERWKDFFDALDKGRSITDWFSREEAWTYAYDTQYTTDISETTADVAQELFAKYFTTIGDDDVHYISYAEEQDLTDDMVLRATRGESFTCPIDTEQEGTLAVDFDNDGTFTSDETAASLTIDIPTTAIATRVKARVTLEDGTEATFTLAITDNVTAARTVTALSESEEYGTALIDGTNQNSITTTEDVALAATPNQGYDFMYWSDEGGATAGTANPFYYYGSEAATFTAHFVIDKWTAPETDDSELSVIEEYQQYVSQFTASQVDIAPYVFYTASSCPQQLYNVVPEVISAARGSSLKIHWTDPNGAGLSYCRLSAYIDLNSDGDFEDEDELIAVIGSVDAQDYSLCNDSIQILLPRDMPTGITHIRMRFDGAWTGDWDATTTAKPAQALAMRMVYEIRLNVTELPSTECSVTVASADETKGSAYIATNGATQTTQATAQPGESLRLVAEPQAGYTFNRWTDVYGRALSTEAEYDFVPAESGTLTASFSNLLPEYLTIDTWTLSYTATDDGELTLVDAISGSGTLNIPEYYTYDGKEYPIVALAPGFLQGNTDIKTLVIGAAVADLGLGGMVVSDDLSWDGDGTTNKLITLTQPLLADEDWTLTLEASTDGSTFNQWGSGLLASGTNALADSYPSGFQLYLAAAGNVVLKCGSQEVKTFTVTQSSSTFTATLVHQASGEWSLTITNASGTSDSYSTASLTIANVSQLSSSIPKGVNVERLLIETQTGEYRPLFEGCVNLSSLVVNTGNQNFATTLSLLYTADRSTLLRYPEGGQNRTLTLSSACQSIGAYALSGVRLPERIVASEALTDIDETAFSNTSIHLQVTASQCQTYGKVWDAPLLVSVAEGETQDATALSNASTIELHASDDAAATLTADISGKQRWYSRTFETSVPYPVFLPAQADSVVYSSSSQAVTIDDIGEALTLYQYNGEAFTAVNASGGKTIPAGAYLLCPSAELTGKELTFKMGTKDDSTAASQEYTGNGTLANKSIGSGCYLYNATSNTFEPVSEETSVPPFTAYMASTADPLPDNYPGLPDEALGIASQWGVDGVSVAVENRRIVVTGTDDYTIHDTAGKLLPRDQQLTPGVYLVSYGRTAVKALVR